MLLWTVIKINHILFSESSVSQIYFEFASISKIRSPNSLGFTVCVMEQTNILCLGLLIVA